MKIYLKSFVNQLKNYSLSLEKTSILIDKPWALIDDEFEMQKLIFKKDKTLILSKNGQVTIGRWDYFAEAKSLLIDRVTDKILCNEGFIDDGVMVLKLDGTVNRYFVLANENVIPDLDAYKYLEKLRIRKLFIIKKELLDGRIIEIKRANYAGFDSDIKIYQTVFIDGFEVEDGKYTLKEGNVSYLIKNSTIRIIYITKNYKIKNDEVLSIEQSVLGRHSGDQVFINDLPAPDGKYKLGLFKSINVKDGKII